MPAYDFAVIGGGIAGASAAYELQARGRTVLLEREALPGHHTTGRSAAFLVESYGQPAVQRLTRAGRDFLECPPAEFSLHPLVDPRPVLWIARSDQRDRLIDGMKQAVATGAELEEVSGERAMQLCPRLRDGYVSLGVMEARARHIDVAGLLDAFVRGFRARGGEVLSRFEVTALERAGRGWSIRCEDREIRAGFAINAAGAWAEEIGQLAGARPIGLVPMRRTAITFDPPTDADISQWPCMIDADEDFYLKPEGKLLLASPCDETPFPPCDVTPDDLDVATAADRVMRATTIEVRHIRRRWAGLRSFVADRSPVIGVDPECPDFCWVAGQGGSGIMTSPAAGRAVASLVVDNALPSELKDLGLTPEALSPTRPGLKTD